MTQRISVLLLVLGAFAYACSPRSHASERTGANRQERVVAGVGLVPTLNVTVGDDVALVMRVTNRGAKTEELRFPDGQTYDFTVLNAAGAPVWKWSTGHMFTQSLRTSTVARGESIEFAERLESHALPKGQYTVVGTVRSENHPLEVRSAIAVR
jgi:hypothetical protein